MTAISFDVYNSLQGFFWTKLYMDGVGVCVTWSMMTFDHIFTIDEDSVFVIGEDMERSERYVSHFFFTLGKLSIVVFVLPVFEVAVSLSDM